MDNYHRPKSDMTLGKTGERNKIENDRNRTRSNAGFVLQKINRVVQYELGRKPAWEDSMKDSNNRRTQDGFGPIRPRRTTEVIKPGTDLPEERTTEELTPEQKLEVEKLEASPTFTLTEKVFGILGILIVLGIISHFVFRWP